MNNNAYQHELSSEDKTKICLKLATLKYSIPNDKYVLTKIKDRMGQEIEEKMNDGLNLDRISQITEY